MWPFSKKKIDNYSIESDQSYDFKRLRRDIETEFTAQGLSRLEAMAMIWVSEHVKPAMKNC